MVLKPVIFPPGRGRPATKPSPTGSPTLAKYYRDRPCLPLEYSGHWSPACEDHVGSQPDQLFREHPPPVDVAGGPTNVHPQIAAIGPTQLRKPLRERGVVGLSLVFAEPRQHADPLDAVGLLRVPCARPRYRRAAEKRDEFASFDH
jgi:hypothetical protein